jgi:hypothetical protein
MRDEDTDPKIDRLGDPRIEEMDSRINQHGSENQLFFALQGYTFSQYTDFFGGNVQIHIDTLKYLHKKRSQARFSMKGNIDPSDFFQILFFWYCNIGQYNSGIHVGDPGKTAFFCFWKKSTKNCTATAATAATYAKILEHEQAPVSTTRGFFLRLLRDRGLLRFFSSPHGTFDFYRHGFRRLPISASGPPQVQDPSPCLSPSCVTRVYG